MDWNFPLRMPVLFSAATINLKTMYDIMVVRGYCSRENITTALRDLLEVSSSVLEQSEINHYHASGKVAWQDFRLVTLYRINNLAVQSAALES
jgi:hypothetical protein